MRIIFGFSLLLRVGMAIAQQAPSFPTNEEMRHYKAMDDPRLSPDGKRVLVRIRDTTADGAKSHLWLIDVEGEGQPRQLTFAPEADKQGEHDGEWMPDGKSILFVAKREEHSELYRLPMDGGESQAFQLKVTPLVNESDRPHRVPPSKKDETPDKVEPIAIDIVNFRVAPDGRTIAVIADDPQTPGEKKEKDAKADAEWVDHSLHGARLYLVDVATGKLTVAGLPIDVRGAAWSADSSKLIVVREEPQGASELGPANSAWVVTMADPAHATRVADIPPTVEVADWSADAASILYLAQAKKDAPPGYSDLYVLSLATKALRDLTDGFAGSVGGMEPLGLKQGGVLEICERGVEAGIRTFLRDGGLEVVGPSTLPVAAVSAVVTNAEQNGFVILGSSGGSAPKLLNQATLTAKPKVLATPPLVPENVRSQAPKRVSWKSNGFTIDGLLYLPPAAASKKVPLVVEVHGGPLGSYLDSYTPFTDFLLGQGWAVLRANPRGSTGRGAEFAAANKNDLGGGDYRDIMSGVDAMLQREPIDPTKLALTGYSYGGEMAAFVEGKTDRFKAIVSMAPVIDQNSEYGTERGSWYDQWYFGKPWEHQADAWRQSPLAGVGGARTPFLLIQGEGDTTDPLGQAQEMYRAMKQEHLPVELVTYPRDDHGPLAGAIYGAPSPEPWHGFDARQRIVDFIQTAFKEQKVP